MINFPNADVPTIIQFSMKGSESKHVLKTVKLFSPTDIPTQFLEGLLKYTEYLWSFKLFIYNLVTEK